MSLVLAPVIGNAEETLQRRLEAKGLIYKASYEGWYSVSDEAYYTSSQIRDEDSPNGPIKVCRESNFTIKGNQTDDLGIGCYRI